MNSTTTFLVAIVLWSVAHTLHAAQFEQIVIPEKCHPAVTSAARIMAKKLGLPETAIRISSRAETPAPGVLILMVVPNQPGIAHDGYSFTSGNGGAIIAGVRPRSLLFAAGDVHHWRDKVGAVWLRDPAFAIRTASIHGRLSIAEYVAKLGVNVVLGSRGSSVTFEKSMPEVFRHLDASTQAKLRKQQASDSAHQAELAQACRDADVDYFPLLYGNDFARWSPALLDAVLKEYPSAKGTPAPTSWERASLCLSDPATGKIIEAYVREFAEQSHGTGLYATFWDHYGLYCQCDRCIKNGLTKFQNELFECVKHYRAAVAPLNQKLVVRTWSSGVPHWLVDQWVHAPGYDNFGGTGIDLWSRVIHDLPPDIVIQTKVYHADCQPDARFSTLLGTAKPHTEIAEWQITGQTTGRFYFPASTVNHTVWTMKKSFELVGASGGVSLFPGGTKQSNYTLFDDIANSINVASWRELAWNPGADIQAIWLDWATPIYGEKAAPHIVKALQLSEPAVNRLFSTLGMGSDTNSGFANTIQRRETLLKYTNRYFLPEGQKLLEPTLENVERVIAEKRDCEKQIADMFHELELAKPDLKKEQYDELATRFGWLREFAIVTRELDSSLWRYRFLRHQAEMLTTDPTQMKFLAQAFDTVKAQQKKLFKFDPAQRFSCYDVPLGELKQKPSLGSPITLMRELYAATLQCVESEVGPEGVPAEWRRADARPAKVDIKPSVDADKNAD